MRCSDRNVRSILQGMFSEPMKMGSCLKESYASWSLVCKVTYNTTPSLRYAWCHERKIYLFFDTSFWWKMSETTCSIARVFYFHRSVSRGSTMTCLGENSQNQKCEGRKWYLSQREGRYESWRGIKNVSIYTTVFQIHHVHFVLEVFLYLCWKNENLYCSY